MQAFTSPRGCEPQQISKFADLYYYVYLFVKYMVMSHYAQNKADL